MPHGKLTSPDLPSVAIVQSVTVVEYAQSVASAIIAVVEPIGEIWSDAHVTRWASVIGVTTLVAANIVRLYQVLALSQTPLATDASAPVSMRAMMIFDADMVLVERRCARMRRWIQQMMAKMVQDSILHLGQGRSLMDANLRETSVKMRINLRISRR